MCLIMLTLYFNVYSFFFFLTCVCAGLLPPGPSSGMVMLQMTAPPCQQPRAPSPCQRKQPNHKHPGLEHQRSRRPAELPLPPDNTQVQTLPDCIDFRQRQSLETKPLFRQWLTCNLICVLSSEKTVFITCIEVVL